MLASRRMLTATARFMRRVRSPAAAASCQRLAVTSPRSAAAAFSSRASDPTFDPYSNKQMSDAIHRIAKVPVIEVDGNVALCNGGGAALGHPAEYIDLDTRDQHVPQTCKYCGLRFIKKGFLLPKDGGAAAATAH